MRAVKELALPLGVYLFVALFVPLVRGAWRNPEFVPHGFEVLSTLLVAVALLTAARRWGCRLLRARARRCPNSRVLG